MQQHEKNIFIYSYPLNSLIDEHFKSYEKLFKSEGDFSESICIFNIEKHTFSLFSHVYITLDNRKENFISLFARRKIKLLEKLF